MTPENKIHLMTPGPVSVHPEILKALARPMVHHLSQAFNSSLERVLKKLKILFETNQPVYLHTSTGSGAMESAVVNTLSVGDDVLVVESGKFGERWGDICVSYGLKTDRLKVKWGEAVDPSELKQRLLTKKYKALLTQACESSTGVLHPIEELGRVCREFPDTILLVDGISSVGAVKLPMDAWNIDVLVTGSQKALMLPAGLAMIALSEKAWKRTALSNLPKYYWDLKEEAANIKKGRTRFSSSVSIVRAMDVALDLVLSNGLDYYLKHTEKKSLATRRACEIFGLKVFAQRPSPTLTAIELPQGIAGETIIKELEKDCNIFLAGGQDHLAGRIIRIGHMGYIEDEDTVYVLDKLFSLLVKKSPNTFSFDKKESALKTANEILSGK